jgi:hypothetical protein
MGGPRMMITVILTMGLVSMSTCIIRAETTSSISQNIERLIILWHGLSHPPTNVGRQQVIQTYAEEKGFSKEQVEDALIGLIRKGQSSVPEDTVLVAGALVCLPTFCGDKGIAVLKEMSWNKHSDIRFDAQFALVSIGGSTPLDFVEEVVKKSDRYTSEDRENLFFTMRGLYLSGKKEEDIEASPYARAVRDVLLAAIVAETNTAVFRNSEMILFETCASYSCSHEREVALQRNMRNITGNEGPADVRGMMQKDLDTLRSMPADKRTSIQIKSLNDVVNEYKKKSFENGKIK